MAGKNSHKIIIFRGEDDDLASFIMLNKFGFERVKFVNKSFFENRYPEIIEKGSCTLIEIMTDNDFKYARNFNQVIIVSLIKKKDRCILTSGRNFMLSLEPPKLGEEDNRLEIEYTCQKILLERLNILGEFITDYPVQDASSHREDSSSHLEDASSHLEDASSHLEDASSHREDDTIVLNKSIYQLFEYLKDCRVNQQKEAKILEDRLNRQLREELSKKKKEYEEMVNEKIRSLEGIERAYNEIAEELYDFPINDEEDSFIKETLLTPKLVVFLRDKRNLKKMREEANKGKFTILSERKRIVVISFRCASITYYESAVYFMMLKHNFKNLFYETNSERFKRELHRISSSSGNITLLEVDRNSVEELTERGYFFVKLIPVDKETSSPIEITGSDIAYSMLPEEDNYNTVIKFSSLEELYDKLDILYYELNSGKLSFGKEILYQYDPNKSLNADIINKIEHHLVESSIISVNSPQLSKFRNSIQDVKSSEDVSSHQEDVSSSKDVKSSEDVSSHQEDVESSEDFEFI